LQTSVEQVLHRVVASVDVMLIEHVGSTLERLSAGVVQVFVAEENPWEDPTLGWGGVCGKRVRTVRVPGNHNTLMRHPHIEVLGKELAQALLSLSDDSSATAVAFHDPRY
jgi:thioesterase domain-containing protein